MNLSNRQATFRPPLIVDDTLCDESLTWTVTPADLPPRLPGVRRGRARASTRASTRTRRDHRRPVGHVLQRTHRLRAVGLQPLQPADLQRVFGVPGLAVRVQELRGLHRLRGNRRTETRDTTASGPTSQDYQPTNRSIAAREIHRKPIIGHPPRAPSSSSSPAPSSSVRIIRIRIHETQDQ